MQQTQINLKWMNDVNGKQTSIKILGENRGNNLCVLSCSSFLLDALPKARETEAKMNYWEINKIKRLLQSKGNI